ncbi:MAG: FmdB family transcriptional regulator [Desulfobacteraceae bacterium 4572_88]|nr:MAG: FmdB family transcriptional regulator [Desulfobacteraceae bacterium 4572_88]
MPIYEFKCSKCEDFFELLVMGDNDEMELRCPKCNSENFERILSSTSYMMGNSGGGNAGLTSQTRKCSSGSCTTYDIPGPSR